jgi:hypothetical protein
MRQFAVSSPKFQGQAVIGYNTQGSLCLIDLQQAIMDNQTVHHFKAAVPVTLQHLENGIGFSKDTTVVEVEYEITFDMFWKKYNKMINRKRCLPLWDKMNKIDMVEAYEGVDPYDQFLSVTTWRKKADPETYLRNEMWKNKWK